MFKQIAKPREQIIAEQVNTLNEKATILLNTYKDGFVNLYRHVWFNQHVTPIEIFDALGERGVELFIASQKVVTHLMSLDPTFTPPSHPYTYTITPSGTVIIDPLPEPEPPAPPINDPESPADEPPSELPVVDEPPSE